MKQTKQIECNKSVINAEQHRKKNHFLHCKNIQNLYPCDFNSSHLHFFFPKRKLDFYRIEFLVFC